MDHTSATSACRRLTEANGPAGIGHRAVAAPRENRAGRDRDAVGSGAALIPGAANIHPVIPGLGVELCCGHEPGRSNADGAGLAVAVRALAVGGAAVRVDLAEVGADGDGERTITWRGRGRRRRGRPADGPSGAGQRAIAPPREKRAGSDRDAVGSGAALSPGAANVHPVMLRLDFAIMACMMPF